MVSCSGLRPKIVSECLIEYPELKHVTGCCGCDQNHYDADRTTRALLNHVVSNTRSVMPVGLR